MKATLSFSDLKGKDWVWGSDLLTGNETDAIKCGSQDEEQPVQPQSPYLPHCMIPWSISGGLVLISLPNRSMSLNLRVVYVCMSSIGGAGMHGRIFWRCALSRSCSGGVTTLDNAVISIRAMHNHPVDTAEIKAHKRVYRF